VNDLHPIENLEDELSTNHSTFRILDLLGDMLGISPLRP